MLVWFVTMTISQAYTRSLIIIIFFHLIYISCNKNKKIKLNYNKIFYININGSFIKAVMIYFIFLHKFYYNKVSTR